MGPGGEKTLVGRFQERQQSKRNGGTGYPAPTGQPLPYFHERSGSRYQAPILPPDMKTSHRLFLVKIFAERNRGVGHIDKAESAGLDLSAIMRDFRAAQGARSIKVNGSGRLIRHSVKPLPYWRTIIEVASLCWIRRKPWLGIIKR